MKRILCFFGLLMLISPAFLQSNGPGGPPPAGGWSILDPIADPVQQYSSDIAGQGTAPSSGLGYIAKVMASPTACKASTNGTTTLYMGEGRWSTTVQEPSEGWEGEGTNSSVDLTFEIWHEGVKQASVAIQGI